MSGKDYNRQNQDLRKRKLDHNQHFENLTWISSHNSMIISVKVESLQE
jgi:hypothetical protein